MLDTKTPVPLDVFEAEIAKRAGARRLMVAISGPPGSGKSTSAAMLEQSLAKRPGLTPQIVPMDGFHYDNAVLEQRGLLSRKGAPNTFDVEGLASILARLQAAAGRQEMAIPVFDREYELSRASARIIEPNTNVLLVEGNYLLLNQDPWAQLKPFFDLTAMIVCDEQTLHARLMKRWFDLGYAEEAAQNWIENNDLPNIRSVWNDSTPADMKLSCC